MKSFVICRMYAGAYLTDKMGSEVINLLHDDHGNNYIYVNPYGYIDHKYDDTVEGVVLTKLLKSGCFEVLGIAKIGKGGQLVYPTGWTTEQKLKSTGVQLSKFEKKFDIRYDGVRLSDIYKGKLGGTITFKSQKLLIPKQPIFITDIDNSSFIFENLTFNLNDKRFPRQSLISYIDSVKNPNSFSVIESLMENKDLWDLNRKNKVDSNVIIDKHFNFLNLIKKEDDELVFSNMFRYFFVNYPELLINFSKKVLGVNLSGNISIDREKDNIDLLISDKKNIIVIENKIKSGINGVSERHDFSENGLIQSQLLKYYNIIEKRKGERNSYYFIFLPNYSRVDISQYSGSQFYVKIKYSELYDFFKKQNIEDKYYEDFVNSLYKHTKDRSVDYYEDMAYRFIQRLKKIKSKSWKNIF